MNNHEYCVDWLRREYRTANIRVLDYGCGAGQLVERLRANGVEAFGCETFYEGCDVSGSVHPALMDRVIKRMNEGRIPFGNGTFDCVISTEVLEHVENLDATLSEMHRVLKPGGRVLSLFPDKGVWREGHCGIPFLHWFPKGSRPRIAYAACLRFTGLGHLKGEKGIVQWSRDFCDWLDRYTRYRPRDEIEATFRKYFSAPSHIEDDWMRRRFGQRLPLMNRLPAPVLRLAATKLGELVFVVTKSAAE